MNSNSTSRISQLAGVGLALVALLLLLPAPVHADTLNVTDDAYVKGTSGGNFGTKKSVKVDVTKGRIGFAKFDLSVLGAIATGADIDTATLRIWISKVKAAGTIDIIKLTSADWFESIINGGNQPTGVIAVTGVPIVPGDVNSFLLVDVDVTTLVKAWLDGDDNFGIAIVSTGARIDIDSKENKKTSHPMEIEVTKVIGANHPHGPLGISGLERIENTVAAPAFSNGQANATCTGSKEAVGGGFSIEGALIIIAAQPNGVDKWLVQASNPTALPLDITAFVVCATVAP